MLGKAKMDVKSVKIKNPRTEDFTLVRTSAITTTLTTLAFNKKKKLPQRIFEIDDVAPGEKDWQNKRRLGMAILDQEINFSEMQSTVESLLRNLGVDYKLKEAANATFIKGRCGEVIIDGKKAGVFGEVSPEVLENFGLDYPTVICELDVESLYQ